MTAPKKPPEKEKLFRKIALERLSSPEELDVLMQVTGPRSWIGLGALGAVVVSVMIWSVLGSIPTQVQAQGVLIKAGGVFDVFAPGSGPVAEVLVREGDEVKANQLVSRLDQPELKTRIDNAKAELQELRRQHKELASFSRQDLSLQGESLALQRAKLLDTIAFSERRLKALQEQIANEESLLERGLITRQAVLGTRQAEFGTRDALERARNELKQLDVQKLSVTGQREQQLMRSQMTLSEAERSLHYLEEQYQLAAEVRATSPGLVLEVKVRPGDIVGRGASLLSLQIAEQRVGGLQAVIYVPPKDGKHVQPGMDAQLSPLSAPREEYGFLLGKVTYVSEFPSTRAGMMKVLANDVLVQSLMTQGAPFAVYADLIVAPGAAGGYAWSSPKGQGLRVNSGTICGVTITVRSRRPIELVIPYIREKTGL